MATSRRRSIAVICAVAVVAMGCGLVAGRFIRSPAQVLADSTPPAYSAITDTVRKSVVGERTAIAATLVPAHDVDVSITASTSGGSPVYSAVRVKDGASVKDGQVLVEVSGRPVMALLGAVPSYRTITPGMTGPDVAQLQIALARLGIGVAGEKGFGPVTQAAVTELYKRAGYKPVRVGDDEVTQARATVSSAEETRYTAADALDQARLALTRARRQTNATAANPATSTARASAPTVQSGSTSDAVEDAKHSVTLAEHALEVAQNQLSTARRALESAKAAAGVSVPLGEITFVASLPATVKELAARVGNPAQATAMRLVSGSPVARATSLNSTILTGVTVGSAATILTDSGVGVDATVSAMSNATQQPNDNSGQKNLDVLITPRKHIDSRLLGTQVRVVITLPGSTDAVLNVATGAVRTDSSSRTWLTVRDASGATRHVEVTTGQQGSGRVQVTPTTTGALKAGDVVLVGEQPSGTPS